MGAAKSRLVMCGHEIPNDILLAIAKYLPMRSTLRFEATCAACRGQLMPEFLKRIKIERRNPSHGTTYRLGAIVVVDHVDTCAITVGERKYELRRSSYGCMITLSRYNHTLRGYTEFAMRIDGAVFTLIASQYDSMAGAITSKIVTGGNRVMSGWVTGICSSDDVVTGGERTRAVERELAAVTPTLKTHLKYALTAWRLVQRAAAM